MHRGRRLDDFWVVAVQVELNLSYMKIPFLATARFQAILKLHIVFGF